MAICNRDLDVSEQKTLLNYATNAEFAVSVTAYVGLVPWPSRIKKAGVTARGLSGAPVYNINVHRWTTAGLTVFDPLGVAATVVGAYGLSGASVQFSVTTSPILLQADDLLVIKSSGANTSALGVVASIILQKTQDIVSDFGTSS
jgi:hypothetical protein